MNKISEVVKNWNTGNLLCRSKKYKKACIHYWKSFRFYAFAKLDNENIHYEGTTNALLKISEHLPKESAKWLPFIYTIGTQCEWEESFVLTKSKCEIYKKCIKNILAKDFNFEEIMSESKKQYEEIITEVKRHLEDAETAKKQHYYLEAKNRNYYRVFEIAIALITAMLILVLTRPIFDIEVTKSISIGLVVVSTLLISIRHIFNFDSLKNQHWVSAQNYQRMVRALRNWKSDYPNEEHLIEASVAVKLIRENMTQINKDAPPLSKKSWEATRNKKDIENNKYETTDQGLNED